MEKLTSLSQLKIGTKLKIIAKSERDCYGSVSVKKLIPMFHYIGPSERGPQFDTEILITRSKNYFFSMDSYLKGESQWVKEIFVLDGIDKRLKKGGRDENYRN